MQQTKKRIIKNQWWEIAVELSDGSLQEKCTHPVLTAGKRSPIKTTYRDGTVELSFRVHISDHVLIEDRSENKVAKILRRPDGSGLRAFIVRGAENRTDGAAQIIHHDDRFVTVRYYIGGVEAKGPFGAEQIVFKPDGSIDCPDLPEGQSITLREAVRFAPSFGS
jgi:hypothetical protein